MNSTVAALELTCDVAVVGCGPTGVVLANLLGGLGVDVVVVERDADVYPVPRATHVDAETMRNLALTGLADVLAPFTSPFGEAQIAGADGQVLLRADIESSDDTHGARGSRFLDQPELERALRAGLTRYPSVRLLTGVAVDRVNGAATHADVLATRTADGAVVGVRASWVVGCDGGRSVVRSAVGGPIEELAPPRRWVIVDTVLRDARHASALPPAFRYQLADDRLTLYAHGHGLHRRWEFLLADGEPDPSDETVLRWLAAQVDLSYVRVTRVACYAHRAIVAQRWRAERVLLAGDAAHLMPPFAGQGMCSGVRDAVNLAWKLAAVCAGAEPTLLDSYAEERRAHVREVTLGALFLGNFVAGDTRTRRLTRDWTLRVAGVIPGVARGMRRVGSRNPPLTSGLLRPGSRLVGRPRPHLTVGVRGQPMSADARCGYRATLWLHGAALDARALAALRSMSVDVIRVGEDVEDVDGSVSAWMGRHTFALVRPDRVVFAAGSRRHLDEALASYREAVTARLSLEAASLPRS